MSDEDLVATMESALHGSYWADNPDLFEAWEKVSAALRELTAERDALIDEKVGLEILVETLYDDARYANQRIIDLEREAYG